MKPGTYKFYVNQYSFRNSQGFKAEVEVNGEIHSYEYNTPVRGNVDVAEVILDQSGNFKVVDKLPGNCATISKDVWGIKTLQFTPVSVVCYSPNYWDEQKGIGHQHLFFMLKDCINPEEPNGYYNEFLKPELEQHRRVFEALGAKAHVKDVDDQLSGVGFSLTKRNDLTEIVLNKLWELKSVGVHFIIIGHVKQRTQDDVTTGQTYTSLTTNMSMRDFNAIKTKLHFLGVASIDREIVQEKTGKTKKEGKKDVDIMKGVITSESRKITFRDDSYSIDSKSRFADIVPEIEFSSDALIKALTDAIKAEASKGSKSVDELKKEQDSAAEKRAEKIAEAEAEAKIQKELSEITEKIKAFCIANKGKTAKLKPLVAAAKEMGYDNPMKVTNIDDAKKILELTVA